MLTKVLIALIRVYQRTLSRALYAMFGPVCRFEPSCSRYAVACLEGHGAIRGTLLSVRRLCKCHPFHPGGYDPPPPPRRPGSAVLPAGETPRSNDASRSPGPAGEPFVGLEDHLAPLVTMGETPKSPSQPVTTTQPVALAPATR